MFAFAAAHALKRLNRHSMQFGRAGHRLVPEADSASPLLLYIHIPFCEALCPFCSFHRVLLKQPRADRYFEALRREIRFYHDAGFVFDDVYLGGGTPTVLPDQLERTLELVHRLFPVRRISAETNPDHLDADRLARLRAMGVNRLSVGVQSFDDRLLKAMGRLARYGSGEQIIHRLERAAGVFDTLNVDMIFNQPLQSMASLDRDLEILTGHQLADQVSFYPLMPATTTARTMSREMGPVSLRNERRFYERIVDRMQADYPPATAWCFARRQDAIDEYIVDHEQFIGAGSGSFSYVNGCFFSSSFSVERYIERVNAGFSGVVMGRKLTAREQLRYRFLVSLFGLELDWDQLRRSAPPSLAGPLWKERLLFTLTGSIRKQGTHYRLTRRGMYHWVVLMREFLVGVNNFRDEMRHHIRQEKLLDGVVTTDRCG